MISLDMKLDKEFKIHMNDLIDRLAKPKQALKECGLVLLRSIEKNFKAGGRPMRWKASKRAAATGGGKTLVDTGRLKSSITMDATNTELKVGTNVKYAAIHQLGGTVPGHIILPKRAKALRWFDKSGTVRFAKKVTIPKITMPKRPFLVVQEEDWRIFRRIFEDYITT